MDSSRCRGRRVRSSQRMEVELSGFLRRRESDLALCCPSSLMLKAQDLPLDLMTRKSLGTSKREISTAMVHWGQKTKETVAQ